MIYDNIQRLVCYEGDTANVFTITNVNDLFLLIIILFIYHTSIRRATRANNNAFFFANNNKTTFFFLLNLLNLIKEMCAGYCWCARIRMCVLRRGLSLVKARS